ncbi:MAG: DEAD/DEAH box helicase, partial [Thermoplasmata archaeon]
MEWIEMEWIKPKCIQKRAYQTSIFESIKDKNALVVLPTGLGKTIIATLLIAYKIKEGKALFLAPTKPLCEQHLNSIKKITTINNVSIVTGESVSPKKRKEVYEKCRLVIATPQTIKNDLGKIDCHEFSLVVFDEAHRAVGKYAYVAIADAFSNYAQILGLTASPGSDYKKLKEVAINLHINHVEVRTENDADVSPYIPKRWMRWIILDMPFEVKHISKKIDLLLSHFLSELKNYTKQAKYLSPKKLSKKVLIDIQQRMQKELGERGGVLYTAISIVSAAIKLAHLKDMLTSQGIEAARKYVQRLEVDDAKSARKIREREEYKEIRNAIFSIKKNPKLEATKKVLSNHFKEHPDGRVIVFAEYRDTIDILFSELSQLSGINATKFIGQAKGTGNGMSQDSQKKTLDAFREGIYNVLISTSIGEEGIDIPSTSLVLFYEPVPSAIRSIQRKGRTARDGLPGEVKILIMKSSRDEAYYWSSVRKEKKMYEHIYRLKKELEKE